MTITRSKPRKIDMLVDEYESSIAKANLAYMRGRHQQVISCYKHAFDISATLLVYHQATIAAIQRMVESCYYCFDYCPLPSDEDKDHYLEVAADLLGEIVCSQQTEIIRAESLAAYAEIAGLAHELYRYSDSIKACAVVADFKQLWPTHAPSLITLH